MPDRALRPGLAATKPRRDVASDLAAEIVRSVGRDHRWTERDMGLVIEVTRSVFARMSDGDGAHFGIRDVLLLPTRDALAVLRATEAMVLSSGLADRLAGRKKAASHG